MPAIRAVRRTGLILDSLTLVACPAPSYGITPVQSLVLLLSLLLLASSDVFLWSRWHLCHFGHTETSELGFHSLARGVGVLNVALMREEFS